MHSFILFMHILTAFVLIIAIVVFQTSKGSALSMFGGGGGDALFNSASGTSFIKKFTATAAAIFAVTSLLLTVFSSSARMRSVVQQYPLGAPGAQQAAPAPAAPAPAAQPAPAKK